MHFHSFLAVDAHFFFRTYNDTGLRHNTKSVSPQKPLDVKSTRNPFYSIQPSLAYRTIYISLSHTIHPCHPVPPRYQSKAKQSNRCSQTRTSKSTDSHPCPFRHEHAYSRPRRAPSPIISSPIDHDIPVSSLPAPLLMYNQPARKDNTKKASKITRQSRAKQTMYPYFVFFRINPCIPPNPPPL